MRWIHYMFSVSSRVSSLVSGETCQPYDEEMHDKRAKFVVFYCGCWDWI